MARGDRFGDRNRDGVNDDIDGQPGNSTESREYAERYRTARQEYSNVLEPQNQIEEMRLASEYERQVQANNDLLKAAQSDVHFFPSVGKFIIPIENTWAAHAELVKEDDSLAFNPEKYLYFDKIIADKLKLPALTDASHPDYMKYEALRTNLEVLRNDIIGHYLQDGAFNPGDEVHVPKIAGIASAIGEALSSDSWFKRPFVPHLSLDVANVEGTGAREIYKFLLTRQDKKPKELTPLTSFNKFQSWTKRHLGLPLFESQEAIDGRDELRLRHWVEDKLNMPRHDWNLPTMEESTPFNEAGMTAAAPVSAKINLSPTLGMPIVLTTTERTADLCEHCVETARGLNSPESLSVPTQERSIDEARTILRWLKNLQATDKTMEEWLAMGTPAEQIAKTESVARLVEIYGGQLKMAAAKSNQIVGNPMVGSASEAAGTMALAITDHTLNTLPDGHPRIDTLEAALQTIPPAWEQRSNHSAARLLEMVEVGIEWASGKNVSDKTSADRLVEMSNRIAVSARKLRSVDSLEPPARIESIELAREILRKLKGLGNASKPVESLVAFGNSEDNAALAQQLDEMVTMYGNLLAEAAQHNPAILSDKRIREASEAVGEMAHSVKLLAAKEIPVSMAASAQISADITQMPEEWKKLSGRTMERLAKTVEGGLEKATAELQEQRQQAQQDEEIAAAIAEQAQTNSRRRRRRRSGGSSSRSATPKTARRMNASDRGGDGIPDSLQGLNLSALSAVREAGGNLRTIGNQANALTPMEVPEAAPIAPDDRSFAQRKTERDDQNKNNPRSSRNRPQL